MKKGPLNSSVLLSCVGTTLLLAARAPQWGAPPGELAFRQYQLLLGKLERMHTQREELHVALENAKLDEERWDGQGRRAEVWLRHTTVFLLHSPLQVAVNLLGSNSVSLGVRLHLLKYVYRHTRQAMQEAILAQKRSRASRSKMELLEWQLAAEENGLESRKRILERHKSPPMRRVQQNEEQANALGRWAHASPRPERPAFRKKEERDDVATKRMPSVSVPLALGSLPWPIDNAKERISTKGGIWRNPQLRNLMSSMGIAFFAPRNSLVRAVLAGTVAYAGEVKGLGKVVVLDHGNEVYTVHAFLNRYFKERGAHVEGHEAIGTVGESGFLEGTGLYFELRKGNEVMDPSPYFAKKV